MGDSKRESFHSYPTNHLYGRKMRSKLGDIHRNLASRNHLLFCKLFLSKVAGPRISLCLTVFGHSNEPLMNDDDLPY